MSTHNSTHGSNCATSAADSPLCFVSASMQNHSRLYHNASYNREISTPVVSDGELSKLVKEGSNLKGQFTSKNMTWWKVIYSCRLSYSFLRLFPGIDTFTCDCGQMEMGERGCVTCSKGPPTRIWTRVRCICGMHSNHFTTCVPRLSDS